MGATFPNGIAAFLTHRNLYDDVDASDINKIQEEIVAIQTVLGALLLDVSDIEADVEELETEQASDNATEVVFSNRFQNLKKQIEYIRNGYHVYAAEVSCGSTNIPKITKNLESTKPRLLKMAKPPADKDPRSLYNGTGLTLRKSGFWVIQGHVRYDLKDGAGSDNYGMYQAAIGIGENWARGMDRVQPVHDNIWANVFLNPIFVGYLNKGARITLRTSQSSVITQRVAAGFLSAVHLRASAEEPVPTRFAGDPGFPLPGPR